MATAIGSTEQAGITAGHGLECCSEFQVPSSGSNKRQYTTKKAGTTAGHGPEYCSESKVPSPESRL